MYSKREMDLTKEEKRLLRMSRKFRVVFTGKETFWKRRRVRLN